MTPEQFTALAELLRLRGGPAQEVVRLVLVAGLPVPVAAATAGLPYKAAHAAVARARAGYALALTAAGQTA